MKTKLMVLAVMATAAQANAGITFDARTDWHNKGSYNDSANVEQKGYSEFEITRARLEMAGKLGENITGKARLDFLKDATVNKDAANSIVNYAYITHNATDMFAVSAGKMNLLTAGIEGQYNGADIYFTSLGGSGQKRNLTGVSFDVAPVENNWVSVFAVNNDDTTDNNQKKMGYGLTYKGSFMDKSLTVLANYVSTHTGAQDAEKARNLMGVGVKYLPMADLTIDLDYFNNVDKEAAGTNDAKTSSIVAQVRYTVDQWSPIVKFESSNYDTGVDASSYDRTRMGVAVEYKPETDKNFRYHVAWDSQADKSKDSTLANQTVTQSQIYVGMRLVTDLL